MSSMSGHQQPTVTGVPRYSTPIIDTKVVGNPDSHNGDSTKFGDWSFKLKLYTGAFDAQYQDLFAESEQSAVPITNATGDSFVATLSA